MIQTTTSLNYDRQNLLDEIQRAQNAMDSAYSGFEQATEPDLIDCYIYMINAASKRYKFLIERAKSLNMKGIPSDAGVLLDETL